MATQILSNFLITTFIIPLVVSDSIHWSYKSQNEWPKLCKTGRLQSPIDIETRLVIVNTSLHIDFKNYDEKVQNFRITNNGHTAQLIVDLTDASVKQPYITGLALEHQVYNFAQLHFHWSEEKGRGSEHAVNGKPHSMEMHIVHYNQKYGNMSEAINHADGLAVVGVLFQITRKENPHLEPIIQGVKYVKIEGSDDYSNLLLFRNNVVPTIELDTLLPNDNTLFYRYQGSLTTPPCSESVTWLVFHDSTDIGLKQIHSFRELMNSNKVALSDTFRQLQNTNDRKIETSKQVPVVKGLAAHLNSNHLITQLSIVTSLLMLAKY